MAGHSYRGHSGISRAQRKLSKITRGLAAVTIDLRRLEQLLDESVKKTRTTRPKGES